MTPSPVVSLSFFCLIVLLLPAQHSVSSHASYKLGSRQFFFRTTTPGKSQQASTVPPATPAQSPAATTAIPINGSDHSLLVSYGTPKQQLPVFLDTSGTGASLLRCKPCTSGSDHCDPAFDMSRSSTFAHVLCGSPECPVTNCSDGSACLFHDPYSKITGLFVQDVLTLTPSMAVHDFRFVCMDKEEISHDLPKVKIRARTLDLSRDRNSLLSHLSSSGQDPAAAFSYCLPQSPSSLGFLSLGVDAAVKDVIAQAPLVSNDDSRMYFIDLVGISLGDEDLWIPEGTFGPYGTILDVATTFSRLTSDAYTSLRYAFRKHMSQYNRSVAGFHHFDTCFNFIGLNELVVPLVRFKFRNGESLQIDADQMMYYDNPAAGPFTMACLAFSNLVSGDLLASVIGTYTLASTEVVYDVAGGTVGFIPRSC